MAGPSTIQRVPGGLLDLLGMQSSGALPGEVQSAVQAAINLEKYYLWQRQEIVYQALGSLLVGDVGVFTFPAWTVPPNQVWLLRNTSAWMRTANPALANQRIVIVLNRTGLAGASGRYFAMTDPRSVGPGECLSMGREFAEPVIIGPGQALAVMSEASTGAASASIDVAHTIVRLTV